MMKVKAIKSFVGLICMVEGDIKEIPEDIGRDLLSCGYVEEIKPTEKRKTTKTTKK